MKNGMLEHVASLISNRSLWENVYTVETRNEQVGPEGIFAVEKRLRDKCVVNADEAMEGSEFYKSRCSCKSFWVL